MNRAPIESKVIKSLGYDYENRILEVEFHSGAVHQYTDFMLKDWNELEAAGSKGPHFSKFIRNQFASRKLEPEGVTSVTEAEQ